MIYYLNNCRLHLSIEFMVKFELSKSDDLLNIRLLMGLVLSSMRYHLVQFMEKLDPLLKYL
jgi:hypothetical protein